MQQETSASVWEDLPQAPQACCSQFTGGAGVGQGGCVLHVYTPSIVVGQLGAEPPTEQCKFVSEIHFRTRVCGHDYALCKNVQWALWLHSRRAQD